MNILKKAGELIFQYAQSGREYLSQMYLKVEANFAALKTWTDSHLNGSEGYRHNSSDVDYAGSIPNADTVREALDNEYHARTEADEELRAAVDAEAEARKQADEELQAAVDAEAEAREQADEELQAAIDAEAEARKQADEELQTAIDDEAEARKQADNGLQTCIDAEAEERKTADAELYQAVEQETQERETADNALLEKMKELSASKELFSALNKENYIMYQILGIELFDGGLFWDRQEEAATDAGGFEEEVTETIDFGDFSLPGITVPIGSDIDGGTFR